MGGHLDLSSLDVLQETVHAILNIREMTGKFSEAEQHCHTPLLLLEAAVWTLPLLI